jgi:hypothetical protein
MITKEDYYKAKRETERQKRIGAKYELMRRPRYELVRYIPDILQPMGIWQVQLPPEGCV